MHSEQRGKGGHCCDGALLRRLAEASAIGNRGGFSKPDYLRRTRVDLPPNCVLVLRPYLNAFEDDRDALSYANAHRAQRIAPVALGQLVDGRGREPCTAGAQRMAERDRAAR